MWGILFAILGADAVVRSHNQLQVAMYNARVAEDQRRADIIAFLAPALGEQEARLLADQQDLTPEFLAYLARDYEKKDN